MLRKTLIAATAALALGSVPATQAFAAPHGGGHGGHVAGGHAHFGGHFAGGRHFGGRGYGFRGRPYYGGGYGYYTCNGYYGYYPNGCGVDPGAAVAAGILGGAIGALGGY